MKVSFSTAHQNLKKITFDRKWELWGRDGMGADILEPGVLT